MTTDRPSTTHAIQLCACGDPALPGLLHRTNGPCHEPLDEAATTDRPSAEPDSRYTTIHGGVQIPDTGTDRPSAATPEEVLTKWQREHILDKGGLDGERV